MEQTFNSNNKHKQKFASGKFENERAQFLPLQNNTWKVLKNQAQISQDDATTQRGEKQ